MKNLKNNLSFTEAEKSKIPFNDTISETKNTKVSEIKNIKLSETENRDISSKKVLTDLKPTPDLHLPVNQIDYNNKIDNNDKSTDLLFWICIIGVAIYIFYKVTPKNDSDSKKINLNEPDNLQNIATYFLMPQIAILNEFKKIFNPYDKIKKPVTDNKTQQEKSELIFNTKEGITTESSKKKLKKSSIKNTLNLDDQLQILEKKSVIELSIEEKETIYNNNEVYEKLEKKFQSPPYYFDYQNNLYEHFNRMQYEKQRLEFVNRKFEKYDKNKAIDITLKSFFKRKIEEQRVIKELFDKEFTELKKEYTSRYIEIENNRPICFKQDGSDFIEKRVKSSKLPLLDKDQSAEKSKLLFLNFYNNSNLTQNEYENIFKQFRKILKDNLIVEEGYLEIYEFAEKKYMNSLMILEAHNKKLLMSLDVNSEKYIEKIKECTEEKEEYIENMEKYISDEILKNLLKKDSPSFFSKIAERWELEWAKDKKENPKEFHKRMRKNELKPENKKK